MDAETGLADHLRFLEEDLLRPEVRRSRDELEARLAPDFAEFGSSGRVYDREALISALAGEEPAAVTIEDSRVRLLAPDVALVTYRSVRAAVGRGTAATSLRSSIWRRGPGGWRMAFHQGTPIP